MATVPTGYVFWDVSANKSYAAGTTFPTLGNGDYLVPATTSTTDGYYHAYWYYTSNSQWGGITITNGWYGQISTTGNFKGLAQKVPFNSIAGKPVIGFSYTGMTASTWPSGASQSGYSTLQSLTNLKWIAFPGCNNLSSTAPDLPTSLESLQNTFYGCTKITAPPSNFNSLVNVKNARSCFRECTGLLSVPTMSGMTLLSDTTSMFLNCTKITSVSSLSPNLGTAVGMFSGCSLLATASVQIPASAIDIRQMFYGCSSLTTPPTFSSNAAIDDIGYMFQNCTSLVNAPTIVSPIRSIYLTFKGCTSLSGNIRIESDNITSYTGAFDDTDPTKQIILLGPSSNYSRLKSIADSANNGNVYAGVVATPTSLTAIRGTYDGTTFVETINGTYCKLTLTYSAPYVANAKFKLPTVTNKNNDTLNLTWHLGTVDGTVINSSGYQIQGHDTLISLINLGSSETSDTYSLITNTSYSYNSYDYTWTSGSITATLTYSNAIIDINPLGNAIAFWGEVGDSDIGIFINGDVSADNITTTGDVSAYNITASGNVSASGSVTANGVTSTGGISAIGSANIGGNLTLSGHSSEVGDRITVQGSSTTSNVPQSADAYVTIGQINLPAGFWIVVLRARFVPSASGNNYPAIYFTSSSTGSGWHQRAFTQGTTNAQLAMTCFANPSDTTQDTPYYLRGYSNTAGTWSKQNNAQFVIDAVRLV